MPPAAPPISLIFDPRVGIAQAHRRRADSFLTEQLALRVIERIETLAVKPRHIALFGPLAPRLSEAFPAIDFIPSGIDIDGRLHSIDNADCSIDLGTLAQVNDLPGALAQIKRKLAPGGVFFSLIYGGASLVEVRQALLSAEMQLTDGASPRLHPLVSGEAALQLLQRAGFESPIADRELLTLRYQDLASLAGDLRAAGLSNQLATRSRIPPPRRLFAAAEAEWLETADGHVTAEIIALTGWAAPNSAAD